MAVVASAPLLAASSILAAFTRLDTSSGIVIGRDICPHSRSSSAREPASLVASVDVEDRHVRREGTMALLFAQHFPHNEHDIFGLFSTMMYAALVDAPRRSSSSASRVSF
jgi:hypothetical protein